MSTEQLYSINLEHRSERYANITQATDRYMNNVSMFINTQDI